jgi:hypothetical protein
MTSNPRRSIVFTAKQRALLEKEAARIGITVGELVRRIIDRHFDKERDRK